METVQKGEGLFTLLRQVHLQDHSGIIRTLKLGQCVGDLPVHVVQVCLVLTVQSDVTLVHPVIEKQEHIQDRDTVVIDVVDDAAVFLQIGGVGSIEQADHLNIHIHQLGELTGRQPVGEHVVLVLDLHVGQACGRIHLVQRFQGGQQAALGGIITGWDNDRHDVLSAEAGLDGLRLQHGAALFIGLDEAVAIAVGALTGEIEGSSQNTDKNRGDHILEPGDDPSPQGDPGDKNAMVSPVYKLAEQHQQARHQSEYCQDTAQDGLDEYHTHVKADPELHEHHGGQAGQRGQTAGGDLRDGLAQRQDTGVPGGSVLPFLAEAVAEDDGIVDGQSQLQNWRNGVGDKRNFTKNEVGAHIQQHGRQKSDDQHRDLTIGSGGQQKDQDHNDCSDGHDNVHLRCQGGRLALAHRAGDGDVITGQSLPECLHGGKTDGVILLALEGHVEQGGGLAVVVVAVLRVIFVPEVHGGDALDRLQRIHQRQGLVIRDVGYHHPGCAKGGELVLHHAQTLAGLRVLSQIVGDIVVNGHPVPGKQGKEDGRTIDQEKQVPFIYDPCGQVNKETGFLLGLLHIDSSAQWFTGIRPYDRLKHPQWESLPSLCGVPPAGRLLKAYPSGPRGPHLPLSAGRRSSEMHIPV